MFRIERHPHGPRLFVLGRRVHEWHLGAALAAAVVTGWAAGAWSPSLWTLAVIAVAAWMIAKDWRDLTPRLRDTGAWRLGVHRRFAPLRAIRYADGLPALAAAVALAIGVVNLLSALTPNVAWRHHLLLQLLGVRAVPVFHTLAAPASIALVAASWPLRGRRRRAWQAAVALLVVLGALDLLKGLDFEEALLSWAAAAFLWWGRDSFVVLGPPLRGRAAAVAALVAAATVGAAALGVWLAGGRAAEPETVATTTADLLAWRHGSTVFRDELAWLPAAVGAAGVALILLAEWLLFRRPSPPRDAASPEAHALATGIVRTHGSDTLAFFKLRRDLRYRFSPDGRAFLGYRAAGGVLLVAGDPIGPPDALPDLVRETLAYAESHGLAVGVLGASASSRPLWRDAGLSSLYLGDEAIVETARFSLEGRAIRKVRQSVNRLVSAGYTVELRTLEGLDAATLRSLEHVSRLWRGGVSERGFSMAMDSLGGSHQVDSLVLVGRDGDGQVRGFLHFVPTYGRNAVSLSFMRRDRSAPNGLTEFLVVRAIELLREQGIEELSLNFAAFGRLLDRPQGRVEHLLGRFVALGSRYFQMESLYRFNAKFSPRWEPRYLLYERVLGLPRAGLAALRLEGQLPQLRRPRIPA
jgi:lysyl-tRNA synthetase class 2